MGRVRGRSVQMPSVQSAKFGAVNVPLRQDGGMKNQRNVLCSAIRHPISCLDGLMQVAVPGQADAEPDLLIHESLDLFQL